MKNERVLVVDSLRGFAILAIIVLHNMEHYEYNFVPTIFPQWLQNIDTAVVKTMYFLFGGKAYAMFALLFGFSFYIQNDHQQKLGNDFSGRFFWRLILLLGFGYINTAFYQGDILTLYAILGSVLIPVRNLSNVKVLVIAIILMLQPYEWFKIIQAITSKQTEAAVLASSSYYKSIALYMQQGDFWDYVIGNITLGKTASLLWSWENGRFFQAPALFLLGLLAGRKQLFNNTATNLLFWKKCLVYAIIGFAFFYFIVFYIPKAVPNKAIVNRLMVVVGSWFNVMLTAIWVASFILLFYKTNMNALLRKLIPMGRMTLTTYIMQSIIGSTLYYKYGFGLYKYTGASMCILIGIILLLLQLQFCKWWLKTYRQGPLEHLWYKLTWLNFQNKNTQ